MSIAQDELDYSNEAQVRVGAETRLLRKRTTLPVIAGQAEYPLEADVIQIIAVYDGESQVPAAMTDDILTLLSSSGAATPAQSMLHYTLEPGTLGFYPTPTDGFTATIFYIARPQPLTSADDFELQGISEDLIERLVFAYRLEDDGQLELAAAEQAFYDAKVAETRRYRLNEQPQRVTTSQGVQPFIRASDPSMDVR